MDVDELRTLDHPRNELPTPIPRHGARPDLVAVLLWSIVGALAILDVFTG